MGNRGILHRALYGPVSTDWQHKSWVACRMNYGGWQRGARVNGKLQLMASLSEYSELFFLDEATAFAAGHRPCGTCRKVDYAAFKTAWCKAMAVEESVFEPKSVDRQLHQDRCANRHDHKETHVAVLSNLPDGAVFSLNGMPYLRWKGKCWQWMPQGYLEQKILLSVKREVEVLTPKAMLAVLCAGYPVQVHRSAAFA